jgi:hypothetical protein
MITLTIFGKAPEPYDIRERVILKGILENEKMAIKWIKTVQRRDFLW